MNKNLLQRKKFAAGRVFYFLWMALISLSKLNGKDFDKAYVAGMVADHKKTLALMQAEGQSGADPDLKAFAAKTAPVVQAHLDKITKIQATLK